MDESRIESINSVHSRL